LEEDRSYNEEAVISGEEMKLDGLDPVISGVGRGEDFTGGVLEALASADVSHTIPYRQHTNISLGTMVRGTTNTAFWL
jgi:hypothetical protein